MSKPQSSKLSSSLPSKLGPYTPTLIIHGGAGNITRPNLPPALYAEYHASLLKYLTSTHDLLVRQGADAVTAACHAVSMMEDDPLFNCGRGAVFNVEGEIEMEASLMVSSVGNFMTSNLPKAVATGVNAVVSGVGEDSWTDTSAKLTGRTKKSAAVSMITRTRHPILLAKEVLGMADGDEIDLRCGDDGDGSGNYAGKGEMHGHLSGEWVENWGFKERGLERKGRKWFWTRKRWEEHRRGLGLDVTDAAWRQKLDHGNHEPEDIENGKSERIDGGFDNLHINGLDEVKEIPSQGTVGAVCMDSWGNLCTATSTGGLTNKRAGRIGDTPTVGAGFWAEDWDEEGLELVHSENNTGTLGLEVLQRCSQATSQIARFWLGDCLPVVPRSLSSDRSQSFARPRLLSRFNAEEVIQEQPLLLGQRMEMTTGDIQDSVQKDTLNLAKTDNLPALQREARTDIFHRAVAMSGTGNGDSFLRLNAVRTAAAISRFSTIRTSASAEVTAVPSQARKANLLGRSRPSLQDSITTIAGPDGSLQRSAGDRWGKSGEGEGGIIGIEISVPATSPVATTTTTTSRIDLDMQDNRKKALVKVDVNVVFDFNCSGMWRAYYERGSKDPNNDDGELRPKIMVFREDY